MTLTLSSLHSNKTNKFNKTINKSSTKSQSMFKRTGFLFIERAGNIHRIKTVWKILKKERIE